MPLIKGPAVRTWCLRVFFFLEEEEKRNFLRKEKEKTAGAELRTAVTAYCVFVGRWGCLCAMCVFFLFSWFVVSPPIGTKPAAATNHTTAMEANAAPPGRPLYPLS
jgi:hypothetical protein